VEADRPIRRAAQQLALDHRDHEHRAVGHPAKPRGLIVDLKLGAQIAGG
jgi:hypothetical protein